ncbi:hypothetical protein [Paenibacillus sp. ISL-20]|uniref:hypothetical protein n=1 Tax=Paenibacillus sp. ISL-20 TaxID=2819163 RepID=UPI001BE7153A|nr:hypothetical protein [Paenibacillus sp. ISL-20]MBT2765099.1 hypothetical protein [Paenibacillus sp. ISL-20]
MSAVMSREEALGHLLENHVFDRWQGDLDIISESYIQNQDATIAEFVSSVDSACKKAAELQDAGMKGDIQYIYLSLLRTSLMEYKASYRIDIHDERWFLDPVECSSHWKAEFIFNPLFQRMRELEAVKSSYARKISTMDIERILQIEAIRHHLFAIEFMRNMVPSILECEGYNLLVKKPNICILAGEYRDRSELLYGQPETGQEGIMAEQ